MAELDVRPKKKSPWWLWLLLALIVIAVIFFFLSNDDNDVMDEDDTYEPETGAVDSPSPTSYAFTNTVVLPALKTA